MHDGLQDGGERGDADSGGDLTEKKREIGFFYEKESVCSMSRSRSTSTACSALKMLLAGAPKGPSISICHVEVTRERV